MWTFCSQFCLLTWDITNGLTVFGNTCECYSCNSVLLSMFLFLIACAASLQPAMELFRCRLVHGSAESVNPRRERPAWWVILVLFPLCLFMSCLCSLDLNETFCALFWQGLEAHFLKFLEEFLCCTFLVIH